MEIALVGKSVRKDKQQLQIGGKLVAIAASFFFALNFC
jgi:hypothetical protein